MSKIYSSEIKYIKKSNSIFKKISVLFLVVVVLTGLFFSGFGFSKLLSGKGSTWFKNNKITIKSLNYYSISFGEFSDENKALECAIWTAGVGGAAYVFKEDVYNVIGQLYLKYEDVNNVINNFDNDLTYGAKICEFKTKSINLYIKNIKDSDKRKVDNDIKCIFNTFENILKISEKLDKNIISNVSASSELNLLKSKVKIAGLNLKSINSTYNDENLSNLYECFVMVEDSIDVCVNKLLVSDNYSNVIKYCACEIFFNYYDFSKNFV